LRKYQIVKRLN